MRCVYPDKARVNLSTTVTFVSRFRSGRLVLTVLMIGVLARPAGAQTVTRLAGADRYGTAAAISESQFQPQPFKAYVATGQSFPDALAAAPAAGWSGGPVLLVTRDQIPQPIADELRRLQPQHIVVVGGTEAISATVEAQLRFFTTGTVTRNAGADRFGTASAVSAAAFAPSAPMAFVATGLDFPDALSAGAPGVGRGPILLVTRDSVPDATAAELRRLRPQTIAVVGGTSAVSDSVLEQLRQISGVAVDRVAGADRFGTSAALSAVFTGVGTENAFLATGLNFPDALAGGAAAGKLGAPVLLADTRCVPQVVRAEVARFGPSRLFLLGGPAALDDRVGALAECETPGIGISTLATGLQVPWDVAFVPGGSAYLTERPTGRLLRRDPNGSIAEVQRFVVDPSGEGGLLGLAASPNFAEDGMLYVFFTSPSDNRIVRFRPGEAGTPILTGLPKASVHDAGRIAFGPDGMLYAATGDAGTSSRSQDPASPAGKILRMTPDGGVPADNPTQGSLVFASGFRDPQGISWDARGRLYADEFGPDRDDEINVVVPGGNYGWPVVTGVADDPRFVDPVVVRQPDVASWSGNAILAGGSIPQWEGDLFVAALRGTRLYRFDLASDGEAAVVGAEELYVGQFGRIRHVEQAPDGSLWLLTSNQDGRGSPTADDDRIIRVGPN
ncbi:MAG TPA: PQQ-dependent sugar dehydrogenase [Acidimicrobiales bacterium]|nr:PQQ-dependent sugar dehydrogenase [Acidimicrobiales bacterium]